MVILAERCWHLQNQMFILRGVLKVKFTKYCTCAAGNPGQLSQLSRLWTGFFIILELEPYMLKAYWGKNRIVGKNQDPHIIMVSGNSERVWKLKTNSLNGPQTFPGACLWQNWLKHEVPELSNKKHNNENTKLNITKMEMARTPKNEHT